MTKVTQAHIDARTKDILDAGTRLFARKGVDDTTMQEIAAEAGLSAGAIYRYYPSKEELLRAVCGGAVEQAREMFDQADTSTRSAVQALTDIGRSAWNQFKSEGCREQLILSLETTLAAVRQPEELGAERGEMWSALIEMLESLVGQAQAAGELDAGVVARALAVTLLASHLGTGLLALQLRDGIDTDAVCDVISELLRRFAPQAN